MTQKTSEFIHRRNFLLHLQERAGYDQTVLLKEPAHESPTSSLIDQMHIEYTITTQLSDVSGVRPAYAMEGTESHPVLLLEYIPGQSLAELIRSNSLDMAEKLSLAVNMSRVLSCIHEKQVMHKDISSGNILVADDNTPGSQGGVYIIDFGLASITRQENPSHLAPDDALVGTLAYISPEQSGRMNRPVDYRTDFYSLGIILYELFTGQLPFESGDTLEMIHAHIARQPQPPQQIESGIPDLVSDIILKLLAKVAEDRYQTAHGLQTDLMHCLDQWQSNGRIEPFELGGYDFTGRLQIPQMLYGRQAEIEQLQAALDRATTGSAQLLFVAGYSGVGKTSLVHEIQKDVITNKGIFIEGKFDQLQWVLPYSAWAQAFTQLVDSLLAESEPNLAGWREIIQDALGENGQILIDRIPDLERIIGPQSEVPQLGGIENQNRFNYIFNRFISSLATPEHPLVVFLDDLQRIDPASLHLIEALMAAQSTSSFLLIGAYRSDEVDPAHPLAVSQERMQAESDRVTVITLGDLPSANTNHLLADTLQLSVPDCRDLDKVLVEKTGGNPFFYRQLLYALEADRLLKFDVEGRHWHWDDALDQSLQARGSVVELMIDKIRTLPGETQRALSLAACLGSRFDTSTLAIITGHEQADVLSDLNPAVQAGLIIRSDGHFSFAHDRIQEAGYALIPPSDLPQTHLKIGRTLLADTPNEDLEGEDFDIVGHLNAGRALIDRDSEKFELARLNLRAGQKAKIAAAYSDAKKFIEVGIELIGTNSWNDQYDLTLALHNENGQLAAVSGQFDQIFKTADLINANTIRIVDRIGIYMTQIEAETVRYNFAKALKIGLRALKELGIEIPTLPDEGIYQSLRDRLVALLDSRSEEIWVGLPEMYDETAIAISSLLASEMVTTYVGNPPLFPIITYRGAILTLEFGLDVWSPFFCASVAMLELGSIDHKTPADVAFNKILFAKKLQQIAQEMLKNPVTTRGKARTQLILAHVAVWTESIEKGIGLAQDTYLSGYQTGDVLFVSNGAINFAKQAFAAGMNLVAYQNQVSDYANSLISMDQILAPNWIAIHLQTAQNLRETQPEPDRLDGIYFNEDEWLPSARDSKDLAGLLSHSVCKLLLAYNFDIDDRLDEYTRKAEGLIGGATANISIVLFYLYFPLSKLRLTAGNGANGDPGPMDLINRYLQLVEIWAGSAPSTFRHKYDLIAAEKARVLGDLDGALTHYEQAINGARENGFSHEEALANELYARFWLERRNERFASQFMREAHRLYIKWGALAKAEHLNKRYPNLMTGRHLVVDEMPTQTISYQSAVDLDLITVLKASQDIAREIELDGLLTNLMTNVIENSGAQQGYLLLEQDAKWMIVAQADVDGAETQITDSISITDTDLLAESIVHYVAHTQETVVLEDASQSGKFSNDPYIQSHQAKSLLCAPLINQGKINSILYLENNLASYVFSPQRVQLLQLLSSQMAISIDNARIHRQLEELLEERSKALSSAEAQIRAILESSPLGIALTSSEGEFLSINKALQNMLGISENELHQWTVGDFYADPADR
ncbi:AAA family ATPase, partial [Chloroflexota bacterium]